VGVKGAEETWPYKVMTPPPPGGLMMGPSCQHPLQGPLALAAPLKQVPLCEIFYGLLWSTLFLVC
jgi:hypothetical protein